MTDKKVVLQALLRFALVVSLTLPGAVTGASLATAQVTDDRTNAHSTVDGFSPDNYPLTEPFENYIISSGLADSPWPKFRQNPQNTGRSPYSGPEIPELKWSFTTGDSIHFSSPAIGTDGTIYVGSRDNRLYAVDQDGSKKWSFSTEGRIYSSPTIGADGTIYVGSADYNLYAIGPDGTLKWSFATEGTEAGTGGVFSPPPDPGEGGGTAGTVDWGVSSSPVVGADGTIYVGSWDGNLYALSPDGSEKWRFTTTGDVFSSPAIGDDTTIYVGSRYSEFYAIDPDGAKKWKFSTDNAVHSSPAIGADGTIYIGSYDNNLYALKPDGTQKWKFSADGWVLSSPAIGADGTIYVGSHDNSLYALDQDGTEKWSVTTGHMVSSSPAIGADGTIYVGSWDNNLYAVNPDGTKKWSFTIDGGISSSPAIGADGTIYVGSWDKKLYAIGEGVPPAPTQIWDWYDLDTIRDNLSGHYVLMNDLDFTTAGYEELASQAANQGMGWQPIGSPPNGFTGGFDGQGHDIRDLFIDRPDEEPLGLFGLVDDGGVVQGVGVVNVAVAGRYRVGSLVGENNGTVSNSYSSGSAAGTSSVGGLVGLNWQGTVSGSYSTASVGASVGGGGLVGSNYGSVSNSHATGPVTGGWGPSGGLVGNSYGSVSDSYATGAVTGGIVGGLVGLNTGTVRNCYSSGSVSALVETDDDWYAGGLAGWNSGAVSDSYSTSSVTGGYSVGGLVGINYGGNYGEGVVSRSYSTGSVTGKDYVGGLVGWNFGEIGHASVSHSYSTGSVNANDYVGGLVGFNWADAGDATVSYSYSTGIVSGSSWVGGLLGRNHSGDVTNSFWDVQTSGIGVSDGGTGKTTAEMKDIRTFNDPDWSDGLDEPWDITDVPAEDDRDTDYIWNIVDGQTYPFLSWEVPAAVTLVFDYPLSVPWTDTLGFGQSWGSYYGHLGEDYAAPAGTPVYAVASGEVVLRHDDPYPGEMKGWGNALIIRHETPGGETIYSQYAHFQDMVVDEADLVELGEQIGTIGQTGFATGPHLHLEIKDTAELGPGFAGYSFTGEEWTHGGVTYYRPSTFIEQYRGFKAGDELAVTGTGGVGLRLRDGPSLAHTVLTVMPEGSKVTVLGGPTIAHGYGWWQVQFGDLEGWAAGRYLTKVGEGYFPPDVPTGLGQYTMDGMPVPEGGEVRQDTIVLKGTVSHPDGSPVKLQVELRPVEEEFQGWFTRESGLVTSGEESSISISELSDGDYHWQARGVDASGLSSEWVSFGVDTEPGFSIRINRSPVALFDYRPMNPVADEEIHFDASASYDWDEAIVSYEWDFGDGQTAFGEQVTHSYSETGGYTVTLTVVDAEGLQGEHSAEVRVSSKFLLGEIDRLVDTAIDDLGKIESIARDLAEATNYFAEEVTGAPRGMAVSGALSIISFAAGPVVPDIDLGELGRIPAPVSTGAGADAVEWVTNQILKKLDEGEGFSTFFISNLEARIEEHRVELETLRVELIENLPDLSEEEVELFVSDLRGRRLGNLFMEQQYWTKAHTVLTYRQLKQDDEESWTWIVGKNLWSWSLRLLTIAGSIATSGGLGAILVSGGVAVPEVSRGMWVALNQLDTDAQMMSMSLAALTDGFVQADRIFENVEKGLENIREETLPMPVKGEIVSIENVVEGHEGIFGFIRDLFSARKAYSQVRIENKGDAPATYDLYAISYRTFSTVGLIPGLVERKYEIPFIWHIQEEIGEGLPPETVTLAFLGEGGGQVPSGKVRLMLIGSNDDGVYGLDMRSTSFDTVYIDQDGKVIPEERARELRVRHYPVRSEVQYVSEAGNFVLTLYVSNEFKTPITSELYQQIPLGLEIVSFDGGVAGAENITWELHLGPGAAKMLEVTLAPMTNNPIQIPAAQYQMYDIINDNWLHFESDPVVVGPPTAEIVGETREVDCAILAGANITVYQGDEPIASTVSDGSGNYTLAVPDYGTYNVVASKAGFRQETQAITVDESTTYTLDFIAQDGLIPNDPDVFYVLDCIYLWKHGEPPCDIDVFRVLDVIYAWKYPILED